MMGIFSQHNKGGARPPGAPQTPRALSFRLGGIPRLVSSHLPITVFLVISIVALPIAVAAQTIEFSRIRLEYREDASFKRISEYFTGEENTGRRIVLRTQDSDRNGFYFSFRIEATGEATMSEGTIALLVFAPGTYEPTEYIFGLGVQTRRGIKVLIGLTGTDWADPKAKPVAWRLEFRNATGQPIGFEESFLWRLPEDEDS